MKTQQIRRLATTRIAASAKSNGVEAIRFRFKKAATDSGVAGTPFEYTYEEEATLLLTPSGKMWLTDAERNRVIRALQETDLRVGVPSVSRAATEQRTLQEVVA